jgi:hypothetical protein
MKELERMEAAIEQLREGVDRIGEPFLQTQIRLAMNVLHNALASARQDTITAALVNEIEFALHDLSGIASELPVEDYERIVPGIATLEKKIAALHASNALPAEVIAAIRAFQGKLKVRRSAVERQTYVENPTDPLPHPPHELRGDAIPLRDKLVASGFATPELDTFIDDPESLRFHSINAIIDELDVIAG